jgi:hypothetical protein
MAPLNLSSLKLETFTPPLPYLTGVFWISLIGIRGFFEKYNRKNERKFNLSYETWS